MYYKLSNRIIGLKWINSDPIQRLYETITTYGMYSGISKSPGGNAYWLKPTGTCYEWIMIKDEKIFHDKPTDHYDFFYGAILYPITDDKLKDIILISKSMYYDRLTQQLIARCHMEGPIIAILLLGVKVANNELTLAQIQDNNLYANYISNSQNADAKKNMQTELCNIVSQNTNVLINRM